jgi:hypothetical protein
MTAVLGIDPGNEGGAALVVDGVLTDWCCWRARKGAGFAVWRSNGEKTQAPHFAAIVSEHLRWLVPAVVAVERLHLQRGRSGILTLAEGTGELIGALRYYSPTVQIVRPSPDQWARLVGGTGPTQTERAWRAMLRGPSSVVLPSGDRSGPGAVGSMESVGAVAAAR